MSNFKLAMTSTWAKVSSLLRAVFGHG